MGTSETTMKFLGGAASTPRASEARILVVDDVEANRSVVCRRLAKVGYKVLAADCGANALAIIETERPDLVLLDYMMPGMNGLEVLSELRTSGPFIDLPVIMLTARTETETVVASLEGGADDYVSKPIDFDVLQARIEAQLAKRRQASALKRANAVLDERVTRRAVELSDLHDQLEQEIAQRRALQSKLDQFMSQQSSLGGSAIGSVEAERISHQLQRIAQIADMLAQTRPGASAANPAALAEIAAIARAVIDETRRH